MTTDNKLDKAHCILIVNKSTSNFPANSEYHQYQQLYEKFNKGDYPVTKGNFLSCTLPLT